MNINKNKKKTKIKKKHTTLSKNKRTKKKNNHNKSNRLKRSRRDNGNINLDLDGGGLFDIFFFKHKRMMKKINLSLKKIEKQNKVLQKKKTLTDEIFLEYKLQDKRKVKQLTELFELKRMLIVYKLKIEEERDNEQKQLFVQNTQNNIALLTRKYKKVKVNTNQDLELIRKEIKPKFESNSKVLKKEFGKFNKLLDKFTELLGKYNIDQMKERYDTLKDVKGNSQSKEIKALKKKYNKHKNDYEKIASFSDNFLDKKNEILEYLDNISTKSAQFKLHLLKIIGDPDTGQEGHYQENQIKLDEWEEESEGFYDALVYIEKDKSNEKIEELILDLKSIKEFYMETNIQLILNNVVPKFNDCIITAEESLSFVQGNKKIMKDIKTRYLQLAPAVDLVENFIPIAQANSQAIENLIAIKQFLQNYDKKNSWEQFFQKGGNDVHSEEEKKKKEELEKIRLQFIDILGNIFKKNNNNNENEVNERLEVLEKLKNISSDSQETIRRVDKLINETKEEKENLNNKNNNADSKDAEKILGDNMKKQNNSGSSIDKKNLLGPNEQVITPIGFGNQNETTSNTPSMTPGVNSSVNQDANKSTTPSTTPSTITSVSPDANRSTIQDKTPGQTTSVTTGVTTDSPSNTQSDDGHLKPKPSAHDLKKQREDFITENIGRIQSLLRREKYDEKAKSIVDLEEKIKSNIEKLINNMKSQNPNKGTSKNPNSIENKIKLVSDYIKKLRKIEADFKIFESGKPIDVTLQKYNLLATMETNRVNKDDTAFNELREKLKTSHEGANNLRKLTGTLSAGDITSRICEYLKTNDSSGGILTSSYPDVKKYLENNPQQIFELFTQGSGMFSIRQYDCNNLMSPLDKQENTEKTKKNINEKIKGLLNSKSINMNMSEFKELSDNEKQNKLETEYSTYQGLTNKLQKLNERNEDDKSSNVNLERMARFVSNGIINIRDTNPQIFSSLQNIANMSKNKEEKDKKKKDDEKKNDEKKNDEKKK